MTKNKRPQKVNKLQIKRLNTWTSTQACASMDAFYHNRGEGWEGKGGNLEETVCMINTQIYVAML